MPPTYSSSIYDPPNKFQIPSNSFPSNFVVDSKPIGGSVTDISSTWDQNKPVQLQNAPYHVVIDAIKQKNPDSSPSKLSKSPVSLVLAVYFSTCFRPLDASSPQFSLSQTPNSKASLKERTLPQANFISNWQFHHVNLYLLFLFLFTCVLWMLFASFFVTAFAFPSEANVSGLFQLFSIVYFFMYFFTPLVAWVQIVWFCAAVCFASEEEARANSESGSSTLVALFRKWNRKSREKKCPRCSLLCCFCCPLFSYAARRTLSCCGLPTFPSLTVVVHFSWMVYLFTTALINMFAAVLLFVAKFFIVEYLDFEGTPFNGIPDIEMTHIYLLLSVGTLSALGGTFITCATFFFLSLRRNAYYRMLWHLPHWRLQRTIRRRKRYWMHKLLASFCMLDWIEDTRFILSQHKIRYQNKYRKWKHLKRQKRLEQKKEKSHLNNEGFQQNATPDSELPIIPTYQQQQSDCDSDVFSWPEQFSESEYTIIEDDDGASLQIPRTLLRAHDVDPEELWKKYQKVPTVDEEGRALWKLQETETKNGMHPRQQDTSAPS